MTPAAVAVDPAKLDALFEPFNRSDRPGLAVGIAHRGRPAYRRGFGVASVELPVALSPSTRIRIGSTTKHFTALCILLLAEDGKLSPEDSVRKHVPELGAWAEPVTLTDLMSHTGGVRCSLDILSATAGVMQTPLDHAEQVKLLARLQTANFAPGEAWMYSNGGYVLLTEVIRRISGGAFESFLQQRVLEPVGMTDSLARPTDVELLPNSATLHVPNAQGGFDRGVFGPDIGGEGSMVSTVDDMLLWLRHMSAPTVGSPGTWKRLLEPASLRDGRGTGYGGGLSTGPYRGATVVQHGGVVVGGTCQMLKVLDHELDVILIANVGVDVATLGEKVIDACVPDLEPVEDEPPPWPFPTGDFYSARTGRYLRLVQTDVGPGLDFGGQSLPLKRKSGGRLWLRTNFHDGGTLTEGDGGVVWTEFGEPDDLKPVQPPETPEAPDIAGRYRSDETGVEAVVALTDGGAELRLTGALGGMTYAMTPAAPGVWTLAHRKMPYGVTLERDGDALLLSSSRARRLRFERAA
jgi:D-aminopeptidase